LARSTATEPELANLWIQAFFLESTFIDQNNPKRQTAGPRRGSPKLDLSRAVNGGGCGGGCMMGCQ
jgi:hypothetical protein